MKLHSQFLQLHSRFGSDRLLDVTMDELAQALGCTHRNALHVVNKMVTQGWIAWTPNRGRGRRSRLEFLVHSEDIALASMKQAISRKDIRAAIEGIRTHASSASLQDTLQGWLLTYFGHHSEIRSDKQIDTLRLPVSQQLQTIDPLHTHLLAESFVTSHVFDGLIRRSGTGHEILPGLAHAWEADETRTTWTFFLRKEVMFHHGKLLTSEDVVYTFERMIRNPQRTLYSCIFKNIDNVTAVSPYAVRFRLKRPNELFLSFLCTSRAAIIPREVEETIGESDAGRRLSGTGPFKIAEMNEHICILDVFPYYFQGRAHLDRVEILYVPWEINEATFTAESAFHLIQNPAAGGHTSWSRIHSESSVRKFITCNTQKRGPLCDPLLRAKIISCLNREPSGKTISWERDLTIHLQLATIPQYAGDAERIAARLAEHGCSCSIVSVSPEEFKGQIRLESDLILFSLLRDQEEQLRLFDLYLTLSEHIEQHLRADIEGELALITRETDSLSRAEGFKRIEQRLIREHQLHILYEKPTQTAYLPSVRGVSFNSQGWVDLRHIWFPPDQGKE